MFKDLVRKTRSYRRFKEDKDISNEILLDFIDTARITPSGANKQPLKYMVVKQEDNDLLFPCLGWAGYLKDWKGPEELERPNRYIIILGDRDISTNFSVDLGISAYSICLSAMDKEIGSCMLGAINRKEIASILNISERYEVLLVIALGYPNEEIKMEKVIGSNIKYFRDQEQIHHVPKRELDDILIS